MLPYVKKVQNTMFIYIYCRKRLQKKLNCILNLKKKVQLKKLNKNTLKDLTTGNRNLSFFVNFHLHKTI